MKSMPVGRPLPRMKSSTSSRKAADPTIPDCCTWLRTPVGSQWHGCSGFTAVWISSSRGHDVVTAQVDASGAKMRNNVYLTSDGRASIESSPQIVRSATGYVAAYAYQPENYSDEAGLMAAPLDANGAPAGAGVRQVPKSPSCLGHSSSTLSSISYYPTNTDLTFCIAATKYKQGALPSLSTGPNGTSMIIWPSWAVGRYDLPTTSYGSYQGRVIFGAKLSF